MYDVSRFSPFLDVHPSSKLSLLSLVDLKQYLNGR